MIVARWEGKLTIVCDLVDDLPTWIKLKTLSNCSPKAPVRCIQSLPKVNDSLA